MFNKFDYDYVSYSKVIGVKIFSWSVFRNWDNNQVDRMGAYFDGE